MSRRLRNMFYRLTNCLPIPPPQNKKEIDDGVTH